MCANSVDNGYFRELNEAVEEYEFGSFSCVDQVMNATRNEPTWAFESE